MTGELSALTAVQVVRAIRAGELCAREYVDAALARAATHAGLNAFLALDHDGARAAADAVDRAVARKEELPALAGLPVAVKDNIDLRGVPTTGATPALRRNRPTRTAPVLQSLLDAGAIPLGKTNMHELALGFTSVNHADFAGAVRNPYDHNRIAGGSSGGTAASIAARIIPVGLGSDTGGSVRLPAALCGIAGLRPSVGDGGTQRRYDGAGVLPISTTRDSIGPMARTVGDVALLDSVITQAPPLAAAPLVGRRLGVVPYFWAGLDRQIEGVAAKAVAALQDAGAVLVEVDLPGLHELHERISMPVLAHEFARDVRAYLAASGIDEQSFERILADVANPDVRTFLQTSISGGHQVLYGDAIGQHRPRLQRLYRDYFAENDVAAMIFPTSAHPAAVIDSTDLEDGGLGLYMRNTGPASCAGTPGLSLFGGMTDDGLPVGIELDGPLGSDRHLLALGLAVEQILGSAPKPQDPLPGALT